jgi:hypothetical protein
VPLLLALTHILDIFDGRNVIAAWVPTAVLVAIGVACARAGRTGAVVGAGLCAVSLAVIAGTNAIPGYQRDDWRGAAGALPVQSTGRVIVGPALSSSPLSIYLGDLRAVRGPAVATREVVFVAVRTRRTGRSAAPPVLPSGSPRGFRLAGVRREESFAVARFMAATPTSVKVDDLRRMEGEARADVVLQR